MKDRPTAGVPEIEIVKGLLRALQREQHEGFSRVNGDMTVLVEQGRLLRDRVANLEARVALLTESRYASYERTGVAEERKAVDLTEALNRIEAALQRLEGQR